jgi:hypothetical protein
MQKLFSRETSYVEQERTRALMRGNHQCRFRRTRLGVVDPGSPVRRRKGRHPARQCARNRCASAAEPLMQAPSSLQQCSTRHRHHICLQCDVCQCADDDARAHHLGIVVSVRDGAAGSILNATPQSARIATCLPPRILEQEPPAASARSK